jgi:hypothetical protein
LIQKKECVSKDKPRNNGEDDSAWLKRREEKGIPSCEYLPTAREERVTLYATAFSSF